MTDYAALSPAERAAYVQGLRDAFSVAMNAEHLTSNERVNAADAIAKYAAKVELTEGVSDVQHG